LAVFLGTITRRLSLSRYQKNKAEKRGSGQIEIVLSELEEVVPDTAASFDEDMDSEIIIGTLNRFLARLPEKQRNVFVMRYWHLKSIEEIANDYELSTANVKQILFRSRKQLKIKLKKAGILL
jgi:RNA polymerase sigma-70 factor (ECF subfamily)